MNSQLKSFLVLLTILGVILALVGLTYLNLQISEAYPTGTDFTSSWKSARAWVQQGETPYADDFMLPLSSMLVLAPFGLMESLEAKALWMTLLEVCSILLGIFCIRLVKWKVSVFKAVFLCVFSLLWYYGLRSILTGQISMIVAVFLVLGIYSMVQKLDILAGIFLALSMIKPSMAVLLVFFILVWSISTKRKEVVWSFLLASMATILASFALLPDWLVQWFIQTANFIRDTQSLNTPLSIMADSMPGLSRPMTIFLYSSMIVYMVIEWILVMKKDDRWFLWTTMLTIVISNLAGYRSGIDHFVLMLPVLFLILQAWESRSQNNLKILTIFICLIFSAGFWAYLFFTDQIFSEPIWVYFVLPIFCLVGLWWTRWWFIRPSRLYVEELAQTIG
jgi:hypothetical protein